MALPPIEQRVKFIFEQEGLDKLGERVKSVNESFNKHSEALKDAMKDDGKYRESQKKTNESVKKYTKQQKKATKSTKKAKDGITDITRANRLLSNSLAVVRARYLILAFAMRMIQQTIGFMLKANAEQVNAELKLANVLKTTGRQYNTSTIGLKRYAAALATTSRHGDELILNSMALLATFKNLSGDTFKEATSISLDLAEVMGTDLKSAAIMVGKALDEPTKGLTALTRVGVSFSDAQRDQVKGFMRGNELAKAQAVILGALDTQFKGGRSSLSAYTMAQSQLSQAFGDLQEIIGSKIEPIVLPIIREITAFMREFGTETDQTTAFMEALGLSSEAKSAILLKNTKAEHDAFIENNSDLHANINAYSQLVETKEQATGAVNEMAQAILFLQGNLGISQSKIEETVNFLSSKGFFTKSDIESLRNFSTLLNENGKSAEMMLKGSEKVKGSLSEIAEGIGTFESRDFNQVIDGVKGAASGVASVVKGKFQEMKDDYTKMSFDSDFIDQLKGLAPEELEGVIGAVVKLDEAIAKKSEMQSKIDTQAEYNAVLMDMLVQMGLIEPAVTKAGESFKEFYTANIQGVQLVMGGFSSMTSAMTSQLDAEVAALKSSDRFKKASSEKQEKMEKDLIKSQAAERTKLAKFDKAANFANAGINIATAITKSLPNIPLSLLIGAMGAFQLSAIANTPIPKFARGGMVGGRRHSQGGTMIEAERGEFVMSRKAVEAVGIEGMNRINQGGAGAVNVNFTGNVMSQDFIEDEAIPMIKEAIRRGADIGVS